MSKGFALFPGMMISKSLGDDITTHSAKRILNVMRDSEIIMLLRKASGRRSAIYAFQELLKITE